MTSFDERVARATDLYESGELQQALPLLLALRDERPDDAKVAALTAWTHDSLGLEEEAVAHYRVAVAGDLPESELPETFLGLASTLRTLGRDDEADEIFRQGIARFPDFRPLQVFEAMLTYNRGQPRAALEQVIKLLLESTADSAILRYRRALTEYADDLDRSWLTARG